MCKAPVLVSTLSVGLIEVIPPDKVAKKHSSVTAESIMDEYPGLPFYITIPNFAKVEHLPK